MPTEPLAFFLTLHAYGTWMHGHQSGSVDKKHNVYGERFLPPQQVKSQLREIEFHFDERIRRQIQDSMIKQCEFRIWTLFAIHVRTTHLHLVVSTGTTSSERAMTMLKAHATRAIRNAEQIPENQKIWSRHGSTRYLWNEKDVIAASRYTVYEQGADLAPAPFIEPTLIAKFEGISNEPNLAKFPPSHPPASPRAALIE